MIQLGPQLYTVREFTQTAEGIEKTFQICHENQYETVQISGFAPLPIQIMKSLLEKYEISVCCTHSSFDRMQEDLDALIDEHKQMHCPVIGLGSMPAPYRDSADGVREFIRVTHEIAARVREAGLQFAYHHHNFEFQKLDGRRIMDMLIEETDPALFHFIPDTYWLQMGGVNPAAYIRKLAGRIEVCHFKDFAVDFMTPVFAEVGCGNLDLSDCFKACMEAGVSAVVIEQDVCPGNPFDSLQISYQNLLSLASAAGDR